MNVSIDVHLYAEDVVGAMQRAGVLVVSFGKGVKVYIRRDRTPELFKDFCETFDLAMTRDEESEFFAEAGHSEAHLEDKPEEEEQDDRPKD